SRDHLHTPVHRCRQGQQRARSVRFDVWAAAVLQDAHRRRLGIADRHRYIVRLPIAHGSGAERRDVRNGLWWFVLEVVDVGDLLLLHPGVRNGDRPGPGGPRHRPLPGTSRPSPPLIFAVCLVLVASIPAVAGDSERPVQASIFVSRTEASPTENVSFWIWVEPLKEKARKLVITEAPLDGFDVTSTTIPDSCL